MLLSYAEIKFVEIKLNTDFCFVVVVEGISIYFRCMR